MGIASPSADVDDIKGLVQKGEQSSQLREWKRVFQVDQIRCKRSKRGQSSETEVNILQ